MAMAKPSLENTLVDACTSFDSVLEFLEQLKPYIINANPLIRLLVVEGLRAIHKKPYGERSQVDSSFNAQGFFKTNVKQWYSDSHPPAVVLRSFGFFKQEPTHYWRKELGEGIDEVRDITTQVIQDLFGNLADDLENIADGNAMVVTSTIRMLALQSLTSIEKDIAQNIFDIYEQRAIKNFQRCLIIWRNETPLRLNSNANNILKNMTIYNRLGVPLFIDNYGVRRPLSSECFQPLVAIENIIDRDTSIAHVTHMEPAQSIIDSRCFQTSLKNQVEGCWFGLDGPESRYGSKSFKTTLTRLGVRGLQQCEIIQYKNEINVIVYASDDAEASFQGLPNEETLKKGNPGVFVHLSFFIPKRFFPDGDTFWNVIDRPVDVHHRPICVQYLRENKTKNSGEDCPELFFNKIVLIEQRLLEMEESGTLSAYLKTVEERKEREIVRDA